MTSSDISSPAINCDICGSSELSGLFPMEMMYGLDGPFRYVHCEECDSTYQPEKLDDYGKYYPASYYSSQYRVPNNLTARLRQVKRRPLNEFYYFGTGVWGRLLARARPCPVNHLSRHVRLNRDMSILEIGSGTGELLQELADLGIRKVVGIDRFVPEDISYRNSARVYKASLEEIGEHLAGETFDRIMFNHALGHSPTPAHDLFKVTDFLKPRGEILVWLPVSDSEISDQYGKYWWSLDAPRHIYIFSVRSMELISRKCGLTVKRVHFEGAIDDYLASELHKAGIALLDPRSYVVTHYTSAFDRSLLHRYEAQIDEQNKAGTATLAEFLLTRISD